MSPQHSAQKSFKRSPWLHIKNLPKGIVPQLIVFLGAFLISSGGYLLGLFNPVEDMLYDFRMKLRGPLTGPYSRSARSTAPEDFIDQNGNHQWDRDEPFTDRGNQYRNANERFKDCGIDNLCEADADYPGPDSGEGNHRWDPGEQFSDQGNGIRDAGLDVALVAIDDEAYRLIPEPYPYGRGTVWSRVVRNLADAGAAVVVFDLLFDSPDHQTRNLKANLKQIPGLDLAPEVIPDGDAVFLRAMEYAAGQGTKIILGAKLGYEANRLPSPDYLVGPTRNLQYANDAIPLPYEIGIVDHPDDADGVSRKYLMFSEISARQRQIYPSLALEAVLLFSIAAPLQNWNYDDRQKTFIFDTIAIPVYNGENTFLLNFYGPPSASYHTFNRYSLSDVLDTEDYELVSEDSDIMDLYIKLPRLQPFKNKIVIIGSTLLEDHDFVRSPFYHYKSDAIFTPGIEIHANAVQQILDRDYFQSPLGSVTSVSGSRLEHLLLILLMVGLTLALVNLIKVFGGLIPTVIFIFLWLSFAIGMFVTDYLWLIKLALTTVIPETALGGLLSINVPHPGESGLLPVAFPIGSMLITYAIHLSYKLTTEARDKRFLKTTFGTYISPELIEQMYAAHQSPKLGGEEGYYTAFFSDIQSFSTFSERLSPTSLVELLNDYLSEMTTILLQNRGTLDKYIGDAIVAFFGAPVPVVTHEHAACLTALQMQERLAVLRDKWLNSDTAFPGDLAHMQVRIGINSGKFVTGNMGSTQRLNYTMMGDAVNTASRLESSAKQYGVYTQVSGATYEKVKNEFAFRELDNVIVVGKNEPVRTYELLAVQGQLPARYQPLLPEFEKGLVLYRAQKWDEAIAVFERTDQMEEMFPGRRTNPSRLYSERCRQLKQSPPGKDWDGVFRLTAK